jgi:hypothetical protein
MCPALEGLRLEPAFVDFAGVEAAVVVGRVWATESSLSQITLPPACSSQSGAGG